MIEPSPSEATHRAGLRKRLSAERDAFVFSDEIAGATSGLARRLSEVVADAHPRCLGGYWPIRSEFNPWGSWRQRMPVPGTALALPWARRRPVEMIYRLWDGEEPRVQDECGLLSADGAEVEPDVVIVPCLGYTRSGWRLGYGGGYFDRYLARRPDVLAIGVAWSCGELPLEAFTPGPYDRPLSVIVTERDVTCL